MAHDEHIRQIDGAFNAEVGWLTQQAWLVAQERGASLRIEKLLEKEQTVCNLSQPNFDVVACNIAQEQIEQTSTLLGIEAELHPRASWEPPLLPPEGSIAVGFHVSGGMPGWYVDGGIYIFAADTSGNFHLFQPFIGGGGTTSFFGEASPVVLVSNAPLTAIQGISVNVWGSAEALGSAGGDIISFSDKYNQHYGGVQISSLGIGFSIPTPFEFHGGATNTFKPLWRGK